jgi:hypothetical protein
MLLWRHVDHKKLAPEGKLRLWLEELYFSCVSPPYGVVSMRAQFCERLSLNVGAFFETLSALLDRGYAPHLLSSILSPFLVGSATTKTLVPLPTKSPYDFPRPAQCTTDLSLFALDTRAVGAMWAEQSELHSRIYRNALAGVVPYSRAIRASVHIYAQDDSGEQLPVETREKLVRLHMGVVFLRSELDVGMNQKENVGGLFGGNAMFDALMAGNGRGSNSTLMRHPGAALFSVNAWDIKTQTATFYVPADAVDALRKQHEVVGVYRSDSHKFMGSLMPVAKVVFHTD